MTALLATALALAAPELPPTVTVPTATLGSGHQFVTVTVDGHDLRMLVDPFMSGTIIDVAVARRIGLTTFPPGRSASGFGPSVSATICRYALGGYAGGYLPVFVADVVGAGAPDTVDGFLGADVLAAHAARVDRAAGVIRVRPLPAPADGRLAGRWVCTAGDTPDGPMPADRAAAIRYDFDGDRVRLKTAKMDERFHFVTPSPGRLIQYRDASAGGEQKLAMQRAVFELSGDTLTVASQYAGGSVDSFADFPTDFKPGDKFVVLRFKRTGPPSAVAPPGKP